MRSRGMRRNLAALLAPPSNTLTFPANTLGSLLTMSRQPYLEAINDRVIVFDGAFGTFVQGLDLAADDFGGLASKGATRCSA